MSFPAFSAEDFQEMHAHMKDFLFDFTAIPSVASDEEKACQFVYDAFSKLPGVIVEKQYLDNSIMEDPYWNCGPYHANDYTGHYNVVVTWKGTGKQAPVLANAHIDTIMPCVPELQVPYIEEDGDTIHGLGVHDDKGHVAIIYGAMKFLAEHNVELPFDFIGHLVVEEEIGGNGSLWAVRHAPEKGQCALMLDGNEGVLMHKCRGSVWPQITTYGVSCHPGDRKNSKFASAYDYLARAMDDLKQWHKGYCEHIKANPVKYFEDEVPQMNVGMIHAGNWPSSLPTEASCVMVIGIFPESPDSNKIARKQIEDVLAADPELAGQYKIEWVFDVLTGGVEADDPLVADFRQAMIGAGFPGEVGVFNAACDIGFYTVLMGIPAINCGAGKKNAHSKNESIKVSEVLQMSHAVVNFLKLRSEQ